MASAPRPHPRLLPVALLLACAWLQPATAQDGALGRPARPNPRATLERFHLKNVKPLTARKAEKVVEGEAPENLPLERSAPTWEEAGFTLDPAPPPAAGEDAFTGEVRAIPVNLGLGFVRPLQRALARAGFYREGFLQDGYFGVYTSSELRRYQTARGLAPTGWADRVTVAKLNAETGAGLDEAAGEEFARAVKGSLRALGFYRGAVDGRFDAGAAKAVGEFQARNGVRSGGMYGGKFKIVRGWVDRATAEKINEMARLKKEAE